LTGDIVVAGDFTAENLIVGSTNLITDITALQTLTATHTTDIALTTADVLTKQELITSSTDLVCNSLTAGFELVKPTTLAVRLNNTFDGSNLLAYDTNIGITGFNGVSVIELRINDVPFHNIRPS
jgi:hypothetical protein